MNKQPTMEEVFTVLETYFDSAQPDDDYNISIIRRDIERYGEVLIPMGLAFIAERLQKYAQRTTFMFLSNEEAGNEQIRTLGMVMMSYLHSVIKAYGERGVDALIRLLGYATDEDVASLAAYMLASSEFVRPRSLRPLKTAFQKAYGTGYKVALALALYRHGDKGPFKSFAVEHLVTKQGYRMMEGMLKSTKRFTQSGIEEAILEELAFPGSTAIFPEQFSSNLTGVLGLITLDMATNGRAYMGPGSPWKRKQYDD